MFAAKGECRLENMRTLCVACHFDVTAEQRAERRLVRLKAKKQLKDAITDIKKGGNTGRIDTDIQVCACIISCRHSLVQTNLSYQIKEVKSYLIN